MSELLSRHFPIVFYMFYHEIESPLIMETQKGEVRLPLPEGNFDVIEKIRRRQSSIQISNCEKVKNRNNILSSEKKGVTLSWHDISVQVKRKRLCCPKLLPEREPKSILKKVSGQAKPGQLLAIMGASGGGKTTLLNTLANTNIRSLDVTGEVKLNGCNVGEKIMKYCAYVQQDDLLHNYLTIKEHLIFQAMLIMNKKLSYEEKLVQVENTIKELSLTCCANTKIGIPGTIVGISGGERKRLAFALEVLANPPIMFCDEPTSGLDSFASLNVVKVLNKLAEEGRTIVFTIHQPSTDIYEILENILLIAQGRVAYMGFKEGATNFFQSIGVLLPKNLNPADYFIYNLAVEPDLAEECKERINGICDVFDTCRKLYDSGDIENLDKEELSTGIDNLPNISKYKASWSTQMRMLLWRCFLKLRRESRVVFTGIIVTLTTSALMGLIFYDQKLNQKGITNINGIIFLILMQLCFKFWNVACSVFCSELPIFLKEHKNGMYRVDTYFLSKSISDLPLNIISPFLCTILFYFPVGLNPEPQAFWICALTLILAVNGSISCGYMISCICGSLQWAIFCGPSLLMPLVIFGGHFLQSSSVPKNALWLRDLSWFFYANKALTTNQWHNIQNITCEYEDFSCMRTGQDVLMSLEFDEEPIWINLAKMFVLFFFYQILAFLFLLARSYRRT